MFQTAVSRVLLIASLALSAAACSGGGDNGGGTTQPGPAANVGVSSSAFTFVAIGASQAVTASVSDAQGAAVGTASITWSSDDPTVAEVSASGRSATIVAKRSGSTTIRATSGSASATISILVLGVKSVSVSAAATSLRVGAQQTITSDVVSDPGVSRSVNWVSANSAIATVNALGVITGVSPGVTTITASAVADAAMTATTQVTVTPARAVFVTPATTNIGAGQAVQLDAAVIIDAGQPQTVTWSSNSVGTATVSQQGIVTGVALGTATITATATADGTLQGIATVNVVPVVRQVAIVPPISSTLFLGQTRTLVATVTADPGLAQTVTWNSTNSSVATVSATGVVTAVAAGSVSIAATSTADASKTATLALTVSLQPVSVSLSTTAVSLSIGNSSTLVATVLADPGVSTSVTWSSSAPNVATVSNGVVTAVANGVAVITATSVADPTKSATATVAVGSRLASSWSSSGLAGPMIENIVSTYVATASSVFTVNSRGDIFHFDGASWTRTAQGGTFGTTFTAVHGSSSSHVIAVGTGGKIVVWNGTSWQATTSSTNADLNDVWVENSTSAFAVGNSGTAVRLTGTSWANTTTTVTGEHLSAVWAAGGNTWFAVGTNGTLVRFTNGAWLRATSPTSVNLKDVFGNASNDVYAVGEVGTVVWFNGGQWSLVQSNGVSSDLYTVTGTTMGGTRIYIGGDRVTLLLQNGVLDAVPSESPYIVQFHSSAVGPNGVLWLGGERGLVLRFSGTAWETMNIAPDLIDVYSTSASNAWAVGEFGFIHRYNGTNWSRQNSPTLTRLNTVWGTSSTNAFAGGDGGLILRWDGGSWTTMTSPTLGDILSIWGTAPNNAFATTYNGEVLRWNGAAWTVVTTQANPLFSVFGSGATDVYAAGDLGTVLRYNGSTWSSFGTGTSALIAGIWASAPNNVLAVGVLGNAAASYRYTTSWQAMNVGVSAELTSVWGPSPADVYVSGATGTILRFDGTSWHLMPTGTFEYLWAITGDPAGFGGGFAVGFNSTLVTGAPMGGLRTNRVAFSAGTMGTLEPSQTAMRSRVAVRSLPQGVARKSARLSHSKRIQSSARVVRR